MKWLLATSKPRHSTNTVPLEENGNTCRNGSINEPSLEKEMATQSSLTLQDKSRSAVWTRCWDALRRFCRRMTKWSSVSSS